LIISKCAARAEKMLADYQEQISKPFEHEARLKDETARGGPRGIVRIVMGRRWDRGPVRWPMRMTI
jgi:hypothetical protein